MTWVTATSSLVHSVSACACDDLNILAKHMYDAVIGQFRRSACDLDMDPSDESRLSSLLDRLYHFQMKTAACIKLFVSESL
ncbi:hypothetical protein LXA43DRAFT_1048922, partial [Ganoderma leucocontextum]